MKRPIRELETNAIMKAVQQARRLSLQMKELSTCTDKELNELVDHHEQRMLAARRDICTVRDEQLRRVGLGDEKGGGA